MQYHVIMTDYGLHRGLEAVVHPEQTRRQVVDEVRDILACDHRSLVHVKFIDGNFCEDVTEEICAAAELAALQAAE